MQSDLLMLELLLSGKVHFHELDSRVGPEKAALLRRQALERMTKKRFDGIGAYKLEYASVSGRNAENVIGSVPIPLGVAGPITIDGEYAKGDFYVPLATTEGALIAGVNRGMKALSASGGVKALVIKDAMARAPLFEFESIKQVSEFLKWLPKNSGQLKRSAEETTRHGRLESIEPFVLGNNVWLRLSFKTGDAMGMNMVTIASEAVCLYIEKNFEGAKMLSVSGNMCSDKKDSYINSLLGRGKTVLAEAVVKEDVLERILRVSAEELNKINVKKNILGSSRAGSSKLNGHAANQVAAIFAATGQDLAQVVESSSCYTWTELRNNDLYISVTMPSLELGTVGGGTSLRAQKEALSIMGVEGSGDPAGSNSAKFAEIVAATVLAGELNLISIQFSRELGKAHANLGRKA